MIYLKSDSDILITSVERYGEMENKNKSMNNQTLAVLALRTAQWCHMFLLQTKRFLDAMEVGTGGAFPWEDNDKSSIYIGDRLFLITALQHAIVNLNCMYEEMKKREENVEDLKHIIDTIASEDMLRDIRDLRNMNEHDIDYMTGNGNSQERYLSIVEKNNYRYQTNAHWTVIIGAAQSFTIGKVQVEEIVKGFYQQMPHIDNICKMIFQKYSI